MSNKNDNMKKKIATGILIGTSITGIASSAVLASNTTNVVDDEVATNVKQSVEVSSERTVRRNKKSDKDTLPDEPAKAPERHMNTKTTFDSYVFVHRGPGYYQSNLKKNEFQDFKLRGHAYPYYGYITEVTPKTFTVFTYLFKVGDKLYYSDESGNIQTGLRSIKGDLYYFGESQHNAYARKGWLRKDGKEYYFDKYGKAVKGFQEIEGFLFYFNNRGERVREIVTTENGDIYYYDKGSTKPFTGGWKNIGDDYFYFDPASGGKAIRNDEKEIGNFVYVFDNYGIRKSMWGIVE